MGKKITDNVTWVGKVDWDLVHFHGDELSTFHGSSYNAYLIKDEKNVLIDTVWRPYDREFVKRLKEVIDLKDIDYIVMNHNEIDHSGHCLNCFARFRARPSTARRKARPSCAVTITRTGTMSTSRRVTRSTSASTR